MYQDPNDIFSTLRDFTKKSRTKKTSKSDAEETNTDKILEISGVISLNNTDLPDGNDKDEEKIIRRDKKASKPERRSYPTLKFKFGRKKSNQENESRRTSTESDPREQRESLKADSAADYISASEEVKADQRESITSSDGLALEILKEINTDNLGVNKGFVSLGATVLNLNLNLVDSGNAQETVELRSTSTSEDTEQREKRRKTRSGNFFGLSETDDKNLIFDIPEDLPNSSSITWPTLNQEPLYQLFSLNSESQNQTEITTENSRPRILDLISTSKRVYWRDIPEVIDSGYSEKLTQEERNLQEAKFEILTSEGSYLKSLKVLEKHYIKNILLLGLRLKHLLSEGDIKILFGNVVEVRKISENFLKDLEELWQNDILLGGVTDVIWAHMENFEIYKIYSKKYLDMTQKCDDLMGQKEEFKDLLERLRQSPPAENLPMTSFFTLPIQRIARYHLLVENLMKFMKKEAEECENTVSLWENLKELARQCDSEIQKRKRTEEMVKLIRQLEFAPGVENICILKSSRYLVMQNSISKIEFREKIDRQHISIKKINYRLFLFNDLFIMAKKSLDKSTPENLIVVDYCLRKSAKMKPMKKLELFGIRELTEANPVILNLQSNHRNESVKMIISFEKPSDREQWITALESTSPPLSKPIRNAQTYQLLIANDYEASNTLELTLKKGDVIEVKEKRTEVWYLGENTETGAQGWFPEECTAEILPGSIKQVKKEIRSSNEKYILNLDGFDTPCESYV